jgi:hypothetical protein
MTTNLQWKSNLERTAFERLEMLLPSLKITGLRDSHQALSLLLRKRRKNGSWDWGLLEDFTTLYELEFSQQGGTFQTGFGIVKSLLNKTFEVKRKSGKLIDLQEEEWTRDDSDHLEKTLGVIAKCIPGLKDPQAAIFLMALGFIVIHETKGGFARRRIHSWSSPSIKERKKREQAVEDFLTLDSKGSDGKSDFTHFRNGFAHGHFESKEGTTVVVWDVSEKGEETFRRELSIQDLKRLVEDSQKKLEMLEVYPNLLIALEGLYRTYKREWKFFRR